MTIETLTRDDEKVMLILACDHRLQFEAACRTLGLDFSRLPAFKGLVVEAAIRVARQHRTFGLILDRQYGGGASRLAAQAGLWTARPVERAGSLAFEDALSADDALQRFRAGEVVKCLCHYGLEDPESMRAAQEQSLLALQYGCGEHELPLLLEIVSPSQHPASASQAPNILERLYDIGIRPTWWKLEPFVEPSAWSAVASIVRARDPSCRGVLILGNDGRGPDLDRAFSAAKPFAEVRGFAIGRAIHLDVLESWLQGDIADAEAVERVERNFRRFVGSWECAARPDAGALA